ncbi:MAG: DUF4251 domain-containing protein [Bacteroidales bacterium]|jgi:hypothetical protein|nr:DUF4251 domain-containing protein [Bacteroidales bacterium]
MKTITFKTAGIFCIMGLLALSLRGFSQETKLTRQEMREVRKAQLAENFRILDSLLNAKSFVLEADFLANKYGDRIVVTPNLNFIKLDKQTGILQTGSNSGFGYNGVGGVTAEGTVGGWRVFKDKKRMNYTVQFSLLTNIGNYDVSMLVSADASARATITGLGPGKLTWEGHLETVGNSRVFKGRNTIG